MKTTTDYLDDVKGKLNLSSDYALAKALKTGTSRIYNYRAGRSSFDDLLAFRIAEILEIDPKEVIAVANLERSKRPQDKAAWREILERISGTAAVILIVIGAVANPEKAMANQHDNADSKLSITIHYAKLIQQLLALAAAALGFNIPARQPI